MDGLKEFIDELYKVAEGYERIAHHTKYNIEDRLRGLHDQIEALEAVRDGNMQSYLDTWKKCLSEDTPRKLRG